MPSSILPNLIAKIRCFRADEDGSVTADYVVLMSALVMMGLAHVKDVADGTVVIAEDISSCIDTDVAAVLDGDPADFATNLRAAGQACASR